MVGLVPILVTAVIGVVGWLLGLAGAPQEVRDKLPPALRDFIEWLIGLLFYAERATGLDAEKRGLAALGTDEARAAIAHANTQLEDQAVNRFREVLRDAAYAHRLGVTEAQRTAWQQVTDDEIRDEIRAAVTRWNAGRGRALTKFRAVHLEQTGEELNPQTAELLLRSPDLAQVRLPEIVTRRPDPIKLYADDAALERLLAAWSQDRPSEKKKGAKK